MTKKKELINIDLTGKSSDEIVNIFRDCTFHRKPMLDSNKKYTANVENGTLHFNEIKGGE